MPTPDWKRIILHADMDAFFAAVEQLDNPELKGKPLLIGGTGKRSVVSTASYEARPFGVGSAMPMAIALRKCPDAIVLPPRFKRYEEVSRIIMSVFASFSPLVEPLSLDEAFLDMSGSVRIFGPPEEMGRKVKEAVFEATGGLTVSVGCANSKFVAKVASDHKKPDGLTVVPPETVRSFLWPMDVSKLWGVGPKTLEKLHKAGLRKIRDVASEDPETLQRVLGNQGVQLHRLANGLDLREVTSPQERKSIGAETTLEQDITGVDAIRPHLIRCADRIARTLRKEGLVAGGVRVKLKTNRFRLMTRQTAMVPGTDNADLLLEKALPLLSAFDLTTPFRLVGMAAFDLRPGGQSGSLWQTPRQQRLRRVDRAADAIEERFGPGTLRRGTSLREQEEDEE